MARVREGRFAPMRTKLLWTALFLVCFMVGRHIPVPFLHGDAEGLGGASAGVVGAANIATGGDYFSPSLFSLGLGPWMGAAILWRFLFIGRLARGWRIPEDTVDRARYAVMLILAAIQAISLTSAYELDSSVLSGLAAQILIVTLLIGGAMLVAWLAHRNEELGLGGISMFVLYQVIITMIGTIELLPGAMAEPESARIVWIVLAACVGVAVIGAIAGNSEIRLHVNKVAIDSGYSGVSYLPIKLNPAGPSPVMYSFALFAIPQYVVHAAVAVLPGAEAAERAFAPAWTLAHPIGFTAYLVLLFGLTIFFGLFSADARDIARRMRDAGEYFDHVPPGRATRRHLRARVIALSAASGLFLIVFTGVPLLFMGARTDLLPLLTAPASVMILLGLMRALHEEVADTMIGTRYEFSFARRADRVTA